MVKVLWLGLIISVGTVRAESVSSKLGTLTAPQSVAALCKGNQKPGYQQNLLNNNSNRMSFVNGGGLFQQGTCWWHSRFQRAATYLTYYSPHKPKPDRNQAIALIHQIAAMNKLIEIPGYHDLSEFSRDWKKEIQDLLNQWQLTDGAAFSWVSAISGKRHVSASDLKLMMDRLHFDVALARKVSYQKMQVPGIPVHAILVIDVVRDGNGYHLYYVDSNELYIGEYHYREGDVTMDFGWNGDTMIYPEFADELARMENLIDYVCN